MCPCVFVCVTNFSAANVSVPYCVRKTIEREILVSGLFLFHFIFFIFFSD